MSTSGKKPPFSPDDDDDFTEIDSFGPMDVEAALQDVDRGATRMTHMDAVSRKSHVSADQERAERLGISHATTVIEPLPPGKVFFLELPTGAPVILNKSVTVIGRAAGVADVVLDGEGVSRQHAAIIYASGAFYVEDLESSNGTKINGERIKVSPLTPGMEFSLGRNLLRFKAR